MAKDQNKKGKSPLLIGENLVISIDENGIVIKLNEKTEKILGYNKNEILNKGFFKTLIPNRYENIWKNIIASSKESKILEDHKIPLITKNGHEIMILWSIFPVKGVKGQIQDIGLVGKLVKSWDDSKEINVDYSDNISIKKTKKIKRNTELINVKKENRELLKENKRLEKELQNFLNTNQKSSENKSDPKSIFGHLLYTVTDNVGSKQKREEINKSIEELEERRKALDELENKINNEKKNINDQIKEFSLWREKLENLENEIYKREKEINIKEKKINDALKTCIDKDVSPFSSKEIAKETIDKPEVFDNIDESAIIVQRGILKQVNSSFTDLTGYSTDEVLDKSLYDFILPEGFPGIEKYYLKRLKGEDISSYETIFLTKNNDKVAVKINTKPTFFKGEKAEIAVIEKLKDKEK